MSSPSTSSASNTNIVLMKNNNQGAVSKNTTEKQSTSEQRDPMHGSLYQVKLLMLFLYRGVFHEYAFELGTEIPEAKKFDDLVFKYTEDGETVYRLLQAKHRLDETKKITRDSLLTDSDGDYSLIKYFFSYKDCKNEKLFKSGYIKDVTIYTNIDFDHDNLKRNIQVEEIKDKDNVLDIEIKEESNPKHPKRYRIIDNVPSILKQQLEDYSFTRLARRVTECILNNKTLRHHQGDIFNIYHVALSKEVIDVKNTKFRVEFIEDNNNLSEEAKKFREAFVEEIKNKSKEKLTLENINDAIDKKIKIDDKQVGLSFSKKFGKQIIVKDNSEDKDGTWPTNAIDDKQIEDYFQHLVFAVNQPNEDELGRIIKEEIRIGFNLDISKTEEVYNKLLVKMTDFLQGKVESRFFSHKDAIIFFKEAISGIPIIFNVINPVALFTGREQELDNVHKKIQRNSEKPITVISQTTTISGLGGIGKTELARKYIYKHINDYDNVIWINAETEQTLIDSFSRLAQDKLKISKKTKIESYVEEVYTFVAKKNSLFVFDNAENNMDNNKFLPRFLPPDTKLHVLITSRNQEWDEGIEVISLDELTPEDAIEFVKKGLAIEDDSQDIEINCLINKLQRFPLAIQQAIAYIKDQLITEEYTINNYIIEFKKKANDLLKSNVFRGIGNDYAKTTFTTWHITIDKISHEQNGPLALKILEVMSYFSPEKINRKIFLNLQVNNEQVNNKQLKQAIRLLVKYSMVNNKSNEQKQEVLSIHRLVQQVTRLELKQQNNEQKIVEKAFSLLKKNYPLGDRIEHYLIHRQLLPHLEVFLSHLNDQCMKHPNNIQVNENINELEIMLINVYFDESDFQKLIKLLEPILQKKIKQYGPNHYKLALTLSNLGTAHGGLGNPHKQMELLEQALQMQEKHYGSDHYEIANTLVNLSTAYRALGDPHKQMELLKQALQMEEKHYGSDHYEIASTLVNLSTAYRALGDPHKQMELLKRALQIKEKHYGSDHFEIANTLVNLSDSYGALGDPHKQMELLERALQMQEKHYSSDHFEIANTLVNLSNAYSALGDPHKQMELLKRALQMQEKHYSSDHFEIATTLVNLSNAYSALGDPHKQMELLERALQMQEKHYGSDHYKIATTLVNLSNAYSALGDPHKQMELLERALQMEEKHYGSDHFEIANTLVNLSDSYGALGDPHKQMELLERALQMQEKHYSSDHFKIANTLVHLSNAYSALGDPHKQMELLERALQMEEKHYGSDHFEIANTLVNLSDSYGALGDPHKQMELLERALQMQEKRYGSDHFEIANTLVNLSDSYGALDDPHKQMELLERALQMQEKHYGSDHFEIANTLVNLSDSYGALGDPHKQMELLERALQMQEKHYGSNHFKIASTLVNLSVSYRALGNPHKQMELLERALQMEEKHYGSDHFEIANTLVILSDSYGALGDPHKQMELLERALQIQEKHYGSDHFEIANTLVILSVSYETLGDPHKQMELVERALQMQEKHYGSDNFRIANTLVNLSVSYGALGDPHKQMELLERALQIKEKHYGSDHFEVTELRAHLGNVLRD